MKIMLDVEFKFSIGLIELSYWYSVPADKITLPFQKIFKYLPKNILINTKKISYSTMGSQTYTICKSFFF